MCLTVRNKFGVLPQDGWNPKTAEKDIVVYKMLECTTVEGRLPYLHKKIYHTPYMDYVVKFNLFGRCIMKSDRMIGEYIISKPHPNCISYLIGTKGVQNIEWINGENISNVIRSNDIGINDKETLLVSEGIHAYTKILLLWI